MKNVKYPGLDFDRAELSKVMEESYSDILGFILQPAFQKTFAEMMSLQPKLRPAFVSEVWLVPQELERRGLRAPSGVLIQTSAFGDRRPTLFVVKKFLPEKYHRAWENVNWTFNNEFEEKDVPNDPESSWRLPLAVSIQNALISGGFDLQQAPDEMAILQDVASPDIVRSEKRPLGKSG